jgi:hypothetical protein
MKRLRLKVGKDNQISNEEIAEVIPRIDKAEIFRRKLWYSIVMSRSKMSFYEMDCKFDLDLSDRISDASNEKRRRKLFEDLRDKNIMPFKGREIEFVDQVEAYDGFDGTSVYYKTPFWKFIQKKPISLLEIRNVVINLLLSYGLLEERGEFESASFKINHPELKIEASYQPFNSSISVNELVVYKYEILIRNLLPKIEFDLDKLSLIGCLMRENALIGNIRIAALLETIFYEMVSKMRFRNIIPLNLLFDFEQLCKERLFAHYTPNNVKSLPNFEKLIEDVNSQKLNKKSLAAFLLLQSDDEIK